MELLETAVTNDSNFQLIFLGRYLGLNDDQLGTSKRTLNAMHEFTLQST
jgi:hypothetical protein